MAEFRALVLHEEGGRVTPTIESVDDNRLPAGEVTVAVEYSSLNYKDGMILQGIGRLVRNYPHVPGIDFAGTVERSDSPAFKPGDRVVLTGWRVGETQWGGFAERARVKADYLAVDLSAARGADDVISVLDERSIAIDVLINNAGFATRGALARTDENTTLEMLQLNIVSLTQLTRLLLPGMLERGYGRIMNVASIGAYMPGPLMAAYYASKAYVLSFSEALSNELAGTGVTVTALCPGPTNTEFPRRAGLLNTKAFKRGPMEAAAVARAGYNAMMKGKTVVIPGVKNKLQMFPTPLVPRAVLAFFARQYNEDGDEQVAKKNPARHRAEEAKPPVAVHSGS